MWYWLVHNCCMDLICAFAIDFDLFAGQVSVAGAFSPSLPLTYQWPNLISTGHRASSSLRGVAHDQRLVTLSHVVFGEKGVGRVETTQQVTTNKARA